MAIDRTRCRHLPLKKEYRSQEFFAACVLVSMNILKGGFHDSAYGRESTFYPSPLHAVAKRRQPHLTALLINQSETS